MLFSSEGREKETKNIRQVKYTEGYQQVTGRGEILVFCVQGYYWQTPLQGMVHRIDFNNAEVSPDRHVKEMHISPTPPPPGIMVISDWIILMTISELSP